MNAFNPATGTVHNAKTDAGHLVQTCGASKTQRASLIETDREITCKRCQTATPKAAAEAAAPREASSSPATWGIFSSSGQMRTFRTTKRDAVKAAGEGDTVRKI